MTWINDGNDLKLTFNIVDLTDTQLVLDNLQADSYDNSIVYHDII